MNATELLQCQQRRLLAHVTSLRERQGDVARFAKDVTRHLALEDSLSAGIARRRTSLWMTRFGDASVKLSIAVAGLLRLDGDGPAMDAQLDRVELALSRQIAFEREELIPALYDAYRDEELNWLGRSMESVYAVGMSAA